MFSDFVFGELYGTHKNDIHSEKVARKKIWFCIFSSYRTQKYKTRFFARNLSFGNSFFVRPLRSHQIQNQRTCNLSGSEITKSHLPKLQTDIYSNCHSKVERDFSYTCTGVAENVTKEPWIHPNFNCVSSRVEPCGKKKDNSKDQIHLWVRL
jgi:hypothetical protein